MSGLQSCSRIFEKSSGVAENKIPENLTFSEDSDEMRALCDSHKDASRVGHLTMPVLSEILLVILP